MTNDELLPEFILERVASEPCHRADYGWNGTCENNAGHDSRYACGPCLARKWKANRAAPAVPDGSEDKAAWKIVDGVCGRMPNTVSYEVMKALATDIATALRQRRGADTDEYNAGLIAGLELAAKVADEHTYTDCIEKSCAQSIAKDIRGLLPAPTPETPAPSYLLIEDGGSSGWRVEAWYATEDDAGNAARLLRGDMQVEIPAPTAEEKEK